MSTTEESFEYRLAGRINMEINGFKKLIDLSCFIPLNGMGGV